MGGPKVKNRRIFWRATVTFALIVLVVGLNALPAKADDKDQDILRALSRAIAKVAADARPAVVSVYTTRTVKIMTPSFPDFDQSPFQFRFRFRSPFEDFFRQPNRDRNQPQQREFRRRGLGSGFIIDAEKGYIVTNTHVIEGADDIKVRLANKRVHAGKLVGADKKTDLAVIQIDAQNLQELELGDSDRLQVGEFVLAIGSPFGLRETVSTGIVSAKGRSNLGIEDYEDFLQTDAAINVGNSGGPLVNIDGKVVGVNTAIISKLGGSVGVGFAIPINMAKTIINQLIHSGKVTRGWLGVQIQDLTPEVAEKLGVEQSTGALVTKTLEDTPAAAAGMKAGDIIVGYRGDEVPNVTKLRSKVAATAPGTTVEIVVLRDGKKNTLTARVGKLSDSVVAAALGGTTAKALGLTVQALTPELSERLGVNVKSGVAVTAVDGGSPAAGKGIKPGDVIIEVQRRHVGSVAEFEAALKKADLKKGVLVLVANRRGNRFVVLKAKSD